MEQIKNKFILILIMLFSIFALISAYFIQYILNHEPCNLCLIERIPYFFAILLIILTVISKKFEKIVLGLLSLLFIFGAIVSFYHFGIEQGFFNESLVCNLDKNDQNMSKEDLVKQFRQTTVSCKDVTFKIFDLSLATINTIISILFSGIMIRVIKNYGKN